MLIPNIFTKLLIKFFFFLPIVENCMVSLYIRFYEFVFFLWHKLYSVADQLFYDETFFSDRSGFLWQKIRRKLFLWHKKICVKEIGFNFCVTINGFSDKNSLFWDLYIIFRKNFPWEMGVSAIPVNIYNYFGEPWCSPPPVFHTILRKVFPPPTCHMSHVYAFFLYIFFLYKVVKLIKEGSVIKQTYPA